MWALIHVNLFEEVSARQYEQAAHVKRATAVSDLNLSVAAGLLTRAGSGPSMIARTLGFIRDPF